MTELKRSLESLVIRGEWTNFQMSNEPGTDLVETIGGELLLNADDESPVWRHKVSALRRAANLLNALADDIAAANLDD